MRPPKERCAHGHLLTRSNTYRHNFHRGCRTCRREQSRVRAILNRAIQREAEFRWLADLPSIIRDADAFAARHPPKVCG